MAPMGGSQMSEMWSFMKITDPALIGRPAREEPDLLGEWSDHGLEPDLLIGTRVKCRGVTFVVNVSYVPANPKRETLVTLLEPRSPIPDKWWDHDNVTKFETSLVEPKTQQEEFPF